MHRRCLWQVELQLEVLKVLEEQEDVVMEQAKLLLQPCFSNILPFTIMTV